MSDDLPYAIVGYLARADVSATVVPFHGAVQVDLIPGVEMLTTGYSGWHYGSVTVLHDGMWDECTCDDSRHHHPPDFAPDGCEDPALIAQGIARLVHERQTQWHK